MKAHSLRLAAICIACGVAGFCWLVQILRPEPLERLERMTYDWRVRQAIRHPSPVSPDLGFVSISDDTIALVNRGLLDRGYGLYWPRHVYARVADELAFEGTRATAFDILFGELRHDHFPLTVGMESIESDAFFADAMRRAGNVIIAAEQGTVPPPLFRTNALTLGDITAEKDFDGVLRRAHAFRTYRKWHPVFQQIENDPEYEVDLRRARVETNRILIPRPTLPLITIPLTNGNIDLADFVGPKIPPGMTRFAKPFTEERIWHMGIVLAAQKMNLDLDRSTVDLEHGRIILRGPGNVQRVIPVDHEGNFYINWRLTVSDRNLAREPFEGLLAQYQARHGSTNEVVNFLVNRWQGKVDWRGKSVVIGSTATGNDLTDRGATPLQENALLVSEHWNVANSILTNEFVHRSSLPVELALITLMVALAAWLTSVFRSYFGTLWLLAATAVYMALALFFFVRFHYWMPLVLPIAGGAAATHILLLAYVVIFEQAERRRLRSVFTKMVPSEVVEELEGRDMEKLSLTGARRTVTVLFADIRGFTEMTDINREKAADFIRQNQLAGEAAEAVFDAQARETLDTVNTYLKVMAETVLRHNGAVDKFIGDCVMAFWGAPIPIEKHALACVHAAIDLQRAIQRLNEHREAENQRRAESGQPLLPILVVGSGINTGVVTAGYMGSDERLNYTVFGRDVNLASRLESVSGRERIIISEATLAEIIQDDPTLALSCIQLPPEKVKGIRNPVPIYEVPWRERPPASPSSEASPLVSTDQPAG